MSETLSQTVRLFTYGTLRSDLQERLSAPLMAFKILQGGAVSEGPAWVRGQLYALNAYPAFIDSGIDPSQGRVKGEVWRIHTPSVIHHLNTYEGGDFIRELLRPELEDGRRVTAWTYKYRLSLRGVPRIASGDYLDWVRSAPAQ